MMAFFKYPFFVYSIVWCTSAYPQCPASSTAWMQEIFAIENSAYPPEKKIEELLTLRSLHIQCKEEKDSVYARIVHRLGDLYQVTGDFDKGISYTKEAVSINKAEHPGAQPAYLAHSYFNLGSFYKLLHQLNESNNYLDSCIQIAKVYPEKAFIAIMALETKAFTYFSIGDFQKGIETSEQGLLVSREEKEALYEAIFLLHMAQSQLALGKIDEAENNIKQAIPMLTENLAPADYLATGYSVYAQLLAKKKDYHDAILYYEKAFQLNLQQEYWAQCSRDMLELGSLYDRGLNDPDKAMAAFHKGIEMNQRIKDSYQLSGLYNNIGVLYWRHKDYPKALYNFQKGLMVLPLQFNDTLWEHNPGASQLKFVANDYYVSTLFSNKGESLLLLYKKEKNTDYLLYALDAFRAADKMVDQMRWRQSGQASKLFWRENTKKMYENAIETCFLLDDAESAFFFFEKSRAVLLNDKLSELGANKYLPPEDRAKEQELRLKLISLQQQSSSLTEDTEVYYNTRQQLLATQEALEKFVRHLENSYPVYYQYKYDTINHTLKDVRTQELQEDQSLVEYFNGDSVVYALAITPEETVLRKVNFEAYNTTARELLTIAASKSLFNQNYTRYQELAYQIYDSLFNPLQISTRRVIISQDDPFIPFESLLTDQNNATSFLLNDYAFSYTYSAAYLMKSSQEQAPLENRLLGIAPVNYQPYLQQNSLDGADFSLKKIQSYFSSTHLLLKEAATKKQFLANLPLYTIVHLYSHAVADSTETEPVLYLYDSTLTVNELQMMGNLQTKMILLSACKTGIGKNVQGEGIFSLARGFASAGIPSIITTLWEIDNLPTYQLSELFYKYLNQGMPSDEALQKAKLAFLEENGRTYEPPYYWASNILIGKAYVMQTGNTGMKAMLTYLLLSLFFIVLGIWVFRHIQHRNLSNRQLEPHEQ